MSDTEKTPKTTDSEINFLDRIIELLTGMGSEERIKARKLRAIAKELNQSKKKYYNNKKDLVLPAFPDSIYEVFRNSQVLARYFEVKSHSKSIKEFLFESSLAGNGKKLKESLSRENIEKSLTTTKDLNVAIQDIRKVLKQFIESFDSKLVGRINETYNQIVNLSYLITYDWHFVVHKFDSNVSQTNFDYKPNFEALEGKYVIDDLIAINDYLNSINFNSDFENVLVYLKQISSDDSLSDLLKKTIHNFRGMKRDDHLTKIIRLVTKDPYFQPKNFANKEKIVQDYVSGFQADIKEIIDACIKQIEKNKNNKLLLEIFNTSVIVRMKNYTSKINDFLESRGVYNGLKYIDAMHYLKAFLLDICKGEIKPRIDYLIIKGTWQSNTLTSKYTQLLDVINTISSHLLEFDEKCSDEGQYGKDLKRYAGILKHDKNAQSAVKRALVTADSEALGLINESIKLIIDIGKNIKELVEDHNTKNPKLIINFHKLKWDFGASFPDDMITVYKKLANMITLLKRLSGAEKPANIK